jgi:hypothetical protein
MRSTSNNKKTLESFIAFCKANPDERFWQALRNWAGVSAVFVDKVVLIKDGRKHRATLIREDTFYHEGKNVFDDKN